MKATILLADDHHIIRDGLRPLLEKERGLQVVGEAENGRQAVDLARELKPDVIIMDISMPDLNGIEATRQILAENPAVKIVALSVHAEEQYVAQMIRAGASGYLPKSCAFKELATAIQTVLENRRYLSPQIVDAVVEYLQRTEGKDDGTAEKLTSREREVLQLLAEGKKTKDIAAQLHVSERTVESHRQSIMQKLDMHSLAELTKYAISHGLTSLEF